MNDEKILVTNPSMPPFEEYVKEIESIWQAKWLTNSGPLHQKFEKEVSAFLGCGNLALMVNGHQGLEIVIQAMGLTGEIITTPFTFVSTANSIKRAGLTPVFCDINDRDYTIDADKIEKLITEKTTAIMPVHVYGNICDTEKIDKIAKKHGLKVIYDGAHAFGEELNGKGIGNFGDAVMFSFHATKIFNTIEGGCITAADNVIKKCNELKNFGLLGEDVAEAGTNAKMNEFQSAMGICSLRHIEKWIEKRKSLTERYDERLEKIKGIRINKRKSNIKYNYSYYPVVIDEKEFGIDRNALAKKLEERNIYARKYFYPCLNEMSVYKNGGLPTSIAFDVSKKVLTLPLYTDLEISQVDKICDIIIKK